jgi:membrane protein DedA with SNARE-associated domain
MPPFLDPHQLIATFGLIGILAIVFAESGLFFGFFLPGDSLLILIGIVAISLIPVVVEFLRARRGRPARAVKASA